MINTFIALIIGIQSPAKFMIPVPENSGFVAKSDRHNANSSSESSTLVFTRKSDVGTLSVKVIRRAHENVNAGWERELKKWRNSRRAFPSGLSIGKQGWVSIGTRGLQVNVEDGTAGIWVKLNYGRPDAQSGNREQDLALLESVSRRAMSIAILWDFAGVDSTEEQRRAALESRGYLRLGPWMAGKGFVAQWDGMKRMVTFTKGSQSIKLAEGSVEGLDGSERKDHGTTIVGLDGELWAKTDKLSQWID